MKYEDLQLRKLGGEIYIRLSVNYSTSGIKTEKNVGLWHTLFVGEPLCGDRPNVAMHVPKCVCLFVYPQIKILSLDVTAWV